MLTAQVCTCLAGVSTCAGVSCRNGANPMASYFGLAVPEGGPIRATSIVADQGELERQSGGRWTDIFEDLWRAGRDAVIGVIGEKARESEAGQEFEQKKTAQSIGELIMSPVGAIAGLLLLVLLFRR